MRRTTLTVLLALLAVLAFAGTAQAQFGLSEFDLTFLEEDETASTRAGAHPDELRADVVLNTTIDEARSLEIPDEELRNLFVALPPGFVGNPLATPRCSRADFAGGGNSTACTEATRVGEIDVLFGSNPEDVEEGIDVFSLVPPPGVAGMLGFTVVGVRIVVEVGVNPDPPYNLISRSVNVSQALPIYEFQLRVAGNPDGTAFLTLPRSCQGPRDVAMQALSWQSSLFSQTIQTHDETETPRGFEDCESLGFDPEVDAAPTTDAAASPSGFDFSISVEDPGLTDPADRAESDLKQAVVTLPEGFAVNPASAGGLDACTEAALERETYDSDPGEGCPRASRLADVSLQTPLLEEELTGSIYLAEPFENPLGEFLAGYLVIKQPERGVSFNLPGKFELDEDTGQIVASFDQNPQFPFSDLEVSFFSGPRAPLSTPPTCGDYEISTDLYPWADPGKPLNRTDTVRIGEAPGGGDCPDSGSEIPHAPGFDAGSVLPLAGHHSPFVVNLRREDGEQRFRAVSLQPPPGLSAKLAGTHPCPEPLLAAAARQDGEDERRDPSCPPASRIGSVYVAAGTGPDPYWAPGTAYLAGPYRGAPLSLAVVTPAVAGPFDLGTVVVRTALHLDPRTARISAVSDPIPEMLEGIPLDIRAVSIRLDRPQFTLNPTSCAPMAIGGGLLSTRGALAPLAQRFQLAECRRLGFEPRLSLRLRGGVKRGSYQALRAVVRPRPGDANISRTVVRFPRSAFVAQEHIRTICTRVQWAADACPKGSVYGRAVAYSPLLDYPLTGNVYLRSSDNELPDAVADLRGPAWQPIRVEVAIRNDSVKGALRNTVAPVPDAPVSYFRLQLFGGERGLIVNSRNICRGKNRAAVRLAAQNGRRTTLRPVVRNPGCKKLHRKAKRRKAKRRAQRRQLRVAPGAADKMG